MFTQTIEDIAVERENFDGRRMVAAFRTYCEQHALGLTEDNLRMWDETQNESRIRATFGTRDEIYEKALRFLYRQFLNRYNVITVKVANGKSIRVAAIRTNEEGIRTHLTNLTRAGLDINEDKIKRRIKTDFQRQKLFGLDIRTFRRVVIEALDELESEI